MAVLHHSARQRVAVESANGRRLVLPLGSRSSLPWARRPPRPFFWCSTRAALGGTIFNRKRSGRNLSERPKSWREHSCHFEHDRRKERKSQPTGGGSNWVRSAEAARQPSRGRQDAGVVGSTRGRGCHDTQDSVGHCRCV